MIKKIIIEKEHGEEVEYSLEEAKELFQELRELFGEELDQPVYVPYPDPYPYVPAQPQISPYWEIWKPQRYDITCEDNTHWEEYNTDSSFDIDYFARLN